MKKLLIFLLCIILIIIYIPYKVNANSSKYITVNEFIIKLAQEIKLEPNDNINELSYSNLLIDYNIIRENDFKDYDAFLTRGDAMVLLNRADEYIYGDIYEGKDNLINNIINNRISDIEKVKENKRFDLAKAYYKGYVCGFSNGKYCTNRELKVNSKMSRDNALDCIKKIYNKSLRYKLRSDGQLIRTTNLPKNAECFESILASFPNKYYESAFTYEYWGNLITEDGYISVVGSYVPDIELGLYTTPANLDELTYKEYVITFSDKYHTFIEDYHKIDYEKHIGYKDDIVEELAQKAKDYLWTILNVDYRTIKDGAEFKDKLSTLIFDYSPDNIEWYSKDIDRYIKGMKKYKTVVECSDVNIDNIVMYETDNSYFLRAHVKYRIVSSTIPNDYKMDFDIKKNLYNFIFYSNDWVDLYGYTLNKWVDRIYEIKVEHRYDNLLWGIDYVVDLQM